MADEAVLGRASRGPAVADRPAGAVPDVVSGGPVPLLTASLRSVLEAVADGVAIYTPVVDERGHVSDLQGEYINQTGCLYRRTTSTAFVGSRVVERAAALGHPAQAEPFLHVARTGTPMASVLEDEGAGEPRHYCVTAARTTDGQVVVTFRDTTHQVRAVRDLQQQRGELAVLATVDTLTGLPNRRAWDSALRRLFDEQERTLAVGLIDLDRFKDFNDSRGHLAGDEHLAATARAWCPLLPAGAVLVRLGGEEFGVLLPDRDIAAAADVLVQMCRAVPHGQTASAGVTARGVRDDLRSLVARADGALYTAKRAGRARVEAVLPVL